MFLHHFLQEIQLLNAPKFTEVIGEINYQSGQIWFGNADLEYEIAQLKEELEQANTKINELEKDWDEASKEVTRLDELVETQSNLLKSYQISPTDTIGDLVSRNDWLNEEVQTYKQSLSNFRLANEAFAKENKELRARKNKVSVKRCLTTGKLMTSYLDKDYFLTEKN